MVARCERETNWPGFVISKAYRRSSLEMSQDREKRVNVIWNLYCIPKADLTVNLHVPLSLTYMYMYIHI